MKLKMMRIVFIFSIYIPRRRIANFVFSFFKEPPYCSPERLYQFIFPSTVEEGSLFFTFSPAFIVYIFK